MFGKLNSTALMVRAEKADAKFEKAMASAQKAKASAARQRILASRAEADEEAAWAEKKSMSATLLTEKAAGEFQLAVSERNKAEAILEAARRNVDLTRTNLEQCQAHSDAATLIADEARAKVPVVESTE